MTRLPGQSLERTWPILNSSQKKLVRDILDGIFCVLRSCEHPRGWAMTEEDPTYIKTAVVGSALAISTHRFTMKSSSTNFSLLPYLDRTLRTGIVAGYLTCYALIIELIVFTHADLHPRNIIVDVAEDGALSLGLVDWKYWEMLKAFM